MGGEPELTGPPPFPPPPPPPPPLGAAGAVTVPPPVPPGGGPLGGGPLAFDVAALLPGPDACSSARRCCRRIATICALLCAAPRSRKSAGIAGADAAAVEANAKAVKQAASAHQSSLLRLQ